MLRASTMVDWKMEVGGSIHCLAHLPPIHNLAMQYPVGSSALYLLALELRHFSSALRIDFWLNLPWTSYVRFDLSDPLERLIFISSISFG
jgi:hypothetical protein